MKKQFVLTPQDCKRIEQAGNRDRLDHRMEMESARHYPSHILPTTQNIDILKMTLWLEYAGERAPFTELQLVLDCSTKVATIVRQYAEDSGVQALSAAPGEPYKEELARLVATVDAGSSADYRALQEHRVMRTARAVLSAAPQQEAQEPVALTDFQEGQWWINELDALASHPIGARIYVTADLMRSVAVVHNLLRAVQKQAVPQPAPAPLMPRGDSAASQLRAMATNYPPGHLWDKLDAKACIKGALEIEALRAPQPAPAPAPLSEALLTLTTDAHVIFNNPPSESSQEVRDVIEWFASSIAVAIDAHGTK